MFAILLLLVHSFVYHGPSPCRPVHEGWSGTQESLDLLTSHCMFNLLGRSQTLSVLFFQFYLYGHIGLVLGVRDNLAYVCIAE